jgi:hypothetical protein
MNEDNDDMMEAVRSAMEQHSQPEESYSEPETYSEPTEPAEPSRSDRETGEQVAALIDAEERKRDIRGRFTKAEQQAQAFDVPSGPPSSWSAEAKSEWERLPAQLQQAVLKREEEISNGFQQYSSERQRLRDIEGIMAPRRQTFQQFGMKSDAEAIERLLVVSDGFAQNPVGTLQMLAQHFGVRPEQIFGQQQQSQESFNNTVRQQAVELAQEMIARYQVQEFERNAPADYGQLKPLMAAAITNGLAADMRSAYQVVTAPARRASEEASRVNRKIAASNASLVGSPHGVASPAKSNFNGKFSDIADDVRAAMNALS